MIGPQAFYQGWERFLINGKFLPVMDWKLDLTGNLPKAKPSKIGPKHFGNRVTGYGSPKRIIAYTNGRVWRNSRPGIVCASCKVHIGQRYMGFTSEVDKALPYAHRRRLCRDCYTAEYLRMTR